LETEICQVLLPIPTYHHGALQGHMHYQVAASKIQNHMVKD